jgi:hypothetical protein
MEIKNNAELTQQFVSENIKRIKNIKIDHNEIIISFDGGGEIIFYADVSDLCLKIDYEQQDIKNENLNGNIYCKVCGKNDSRSFVNGMCQDCYDRFVLRKV